MKNREMLRPKDNKAIVFIFSVAILIYIVNIVIAIIYPNIFNSVCGWICTIINAISVTILSWQKK